MNRYHRCRERGEGVLGGEGAAAGGGVVGRSGQPRLARLQVPQPLRRGAPISSLLSAKPLASDCFVSEVTTRLRSRLNFVPPSTW